MNKARIDDVLASRYASPKMCEIWSPEKKVRLERELWIAVMKAQRRLGIDIPEEAIRAYEKQKDNIDLESIGQRERITRHDVKARIEEFCHLAGYEHIHKGMTSRDLTDNVEQLQVRLSLEAIRGKAVSCLRHLRENAARFRDVVIAARTHNVAAQPTTVGRRLAMFGEEMLIAFNRLESLLAHYPLRGIAGPVGTGVDQKTLLGSEEKVAELNSEIMKQLGFEANLRCTGQVYPRSLDFEAVSVLYQLGSGPANFARTLRLMAGNELAHEGFKKGQVGSSAMPHKMNSRSCERINGFQVILNGYLNMVSGLCGDQWNEGDVSCSVVRRVALPGAMFAADGMLETFLVIQKEFAVYEAMVSSELDRILPFLASTTLLMAAVQRGAGREKAHEIIKRHAVEMVRKMRQTGDQINTLADVLGHDPEFPLTAGEIETLLEDKFAFAGSAQGQTDDFCQRVEQVEKKFPGAAEYEPGDIL
jgi:adenylosuccinate lyase